MVSLLMAKCTQLSRQPQMTIKERRRTFAKQKKKKSTQEVNVKHTITRSVLIAVMVNSNCPVESLASQA